MSSIIEILSSSFSIILQSEFDDSTTSIKDDFQLLSRDFEFTGDDLRFGIDQEIDDE